MFTHMLKIFDDDDTHNVNAIDMSEKDYFPVFQ